MSLSLLSSAIPQFEASNIFAFAQQLFQLQLSRLPYSAPVAGSSCSERVFHFHSSLPNYRCACGRSLFACYASCLFGWFLVCTPHPEHDHRDRPPPQLYKVGTAGPHRPRLIARNTLLDIKITGRYQANHRLFIRNVPNAINSHHILWGLERCAYATTVPSLHDVAKHLMLFTSLRPGRGGRRKIGCFGTLLSELAKDSAIPQLIPIVGRQKESSFSLPKAVI